MSQYKVNIFYINKKNYFHKGLYFNDNFLFQKISNYFN